MEIMIISLRSSNALDFFWTPNLSLHHERELKGDVFVWDLFASSFSSPHLAYPFTIEIQ